MKRVLWIIAALLILAIGGGVIWLKSNQEWVAAAIGKAVESATGRPLALESPPSLTIFPSLGIDLEKASWGNTEKDELAVKVDSAQVRLELVPLFSKKIEVSEIVLNNPRVNLRAGDKVSSATQAPQKTLKNAVPAAPATDKTNSSTTSPDTAMPLDFNLAKVSINNGELVLDMPDMRLHLAKLNLRLTDLAPGKLGALDISTAATLAQKTQSLSSNLELRTTFTPKLPLIEIRNLELRLSPLKGIVETPVRLSGNVDVYTVNPRLEKIGLTTETAGSTLSLNGQLQFEELAGHFTFALNGAPRQTLTAFGLNFTPADSTALNALNLAGSLRLKKDSLEAGELKGKLDDTAFTAALSASMPVKMTMNLTLDTVNIDRYLPAPSNSSAQQSQGGGAQAPQTAAPSKAAATQAPKASSTQKTPTYPELKVDLSAKSLQVKGMRLDNVVAKAQGKQGSYTLTPTFVFYESKVASTIKAELPKEQYRLQLNADNFNAGALLRDLAKIDKVESRVNLRTDLSITGSSEAAVRRSLSGTTKLTGQANISTDILPKEWDPLLGNIRTISLSTMDIQAQAKNGQIALKPVNAAGSVYKIAGNGQINLPANTIDLRLNTSISKVTMPLVVSGNLNNPSYGIDPAGVIQNILERPEVIEKGTKALEQGAKNLLRKLR